MPERIRSITLACGAVLYAAVATTTPARADEVSRWNQIATDVAAAAHADPLTESRTFAMLHLAIHDAVNRVEPRFERYVRGPLDAPGGAATVAASVAAHDMLVALLPDGRATYDAALESTLRAAGEGPEATRGAEAGRAAAHAVLEDRVADGSTRSVVAPPGTKPGAYRPTPPDLTPAWAAHWGDVKPFVLRSPSQFRPEPPPAVYGDRALADIRTVREIGAKEGSTRTDEQSAIARFWYENSTQGWNRIARIVAASRNLDLHASARLFALVNLALADGYIAVFEAKYRYDYWRPVTAIREMGDRDWLSVLDTPPIPDYPSGHTVVGAAAAAVLARCLGSDFVPFRFVSGDPYPGIERSFWSFSEAAQENGASRVLAGIHFPTAVEAGYAQGDAVGTWVFEHALRPLRSERASNRR